jgi:hypothetical protein
MQTALFDREVVLLHNLSASGLFFAYSEEMAEGTVLDFNINFPPLAPLYRTGVVVRNESMGPRELTYIATRFIETTDAETELTDQAIKELCTKRKRTGARYFSLGTS